MTNITVFEPSEDYIDLLNDIVGVYEQYCGCGGSLHIVLEDQNWDRGSIEFCLKYAQDKGDYVGEAIAKMLLKMPDEIIAQCKTDGGGYGLQLGLSAWKKLVNNII